MSASSSQLSELFRAARDGSEEAAREIIDRYSGAIRRAVRHLMHHRLRSKFDSDDFEQAVWASLFANREDLDEFRDSDGLMRYLVQMARNKVIDEFRRRVQGQKYNVYREQPLGLPDKQDVIAAERQPTPSQTAIAKEEWERILANEPSRNRRIIRMKRQGATFEQIAEAESINERTARRVIRRAHTRRTDPKTPGNDR